MPTESHDLFIETKDDFISVKGRVDGKEFTVFRFSTSLLGTAHVVGVEINADPNLPTDGPKPHYTGFCMDIHPQKETT